ncbi:MAG: hypothetical protein ACOCY1_05745, partial [Halovenus sp.]
MEPGRIDALIDLSYGVLIFVAVVLMAVVGQQTGIAFALGVLVSYALHVVWKMGRFDPEWMTQAVEETVETTVGETVEETVGEQVDESVERSVGEAVEKQV